MLPAEHFGTPSGSVPRTLGTTGGNEYWKDYITTSLDLQEGVGVIYQPDLNVVLGLEDFGNNTLKNGLFRSTSTLGFWEMQLGSDSDCGHTVRWWWIWDYARPTDTSAPTWADIFTENSIWATTRRDVDSRFRVIQKGYTRVVGKNCGYRKTATGTVSGYHVTAVADGTFVGTAELLASLVLAGTVGPLPPQVLAGTAIGPVTGALTGTTAGFVNWDVPTQDISMDIYYPPHPAAKKADEIFVRWPADAFTKVKQDPTSLLPPTCSGGEPLLCIIADDIGDLPPTFTAVTVTMKLRHNFCTGTPKDIVP